MNIIDQMNLFSSSWETLIKNVANASYKLDNFGSLEEIHRNEMINVIIENKSNNIAVLHQEAQIKLRKELDSKITEARKKEIVRLLESISNVKLLGEYKPKEKNIYLYIETIKSCGKDVDNLVLTTYVHEMMHAYFDRKGHEQYPYIYETEEPLAEAGMLLFLDKTQNLVLPWAINNVKGKSPDLKEYAQGAELYEEWKKNKIDLETMVTSYKNLYFHKPHNGITLSTWKHKRDLFEEWLLSIGSAPSSAVYNACYIPLLRLMKYVINDVTNGQTECLFDVVSKQQIYSIRCAINSYYGSYSSIEKNLKVVDLYEEYLYATNQIQP